MSERDKIGRVEDYTIPFLVSAGVMLFSFGMVVWAKYGLAWVMIVAGLLDLLIQRLRPRP